MRLESSPRRKDAMGITATLQDLPIPLTATLLHPWPILRALEKQHSDLHGFFSPRTTGACLGALDNGGWIPLHSLGFGVGSFI